MRGSAVFLQARMDSTRLPGKALMELSGLTVIEHAMRALKKIPADHHVLLTAKGDEAFFSDPVEKQGFSLFAGSREDVLERFIQAGDAYKADIVIRATGDNPLVAYESASFLLKQMRENPPWDYCAMKGLPLGCGVEVFRLDALKNAAFQTTEPYDHEHVTPFLYNHPGQYHLHYFEAPPVYASEERVTLDTGEDFERLSHIFKSLYRKEPVQIETLVRYLKEK